MKIHIEDNEFSITQSGNSCLLSVDQSLYDWAKMWINSEEKTKFSIDGELADGRLVTFHGCQILPLNPIQESIDTMNNVAHTVTIYYDYYKLD